MLRFDWVRPRAPIRAPSLHHPGCWDVVTQLAKEWFLKPLGTFPFLLFCDFSICTTARGRLWASKRRRLCLRHQQVFADVQQQVLHVTEGGSSPGEPRKEPFTHPRNDVRDRSSDMRHDRSVPFSTLWLWKLKELIQNVKQPKRWDFHAFKLLCFLFHLFLNLVLSCFFFFIQTQQNEPQNFQTQVEVIYCYKCVKVLIRSVKLNILFFFTVGKMTPNPDRRWNKCSRTEVRIPSFTICSQYDMTDRLSLPFEGILKSFQDFLRSEFSDENVEFWLACQAYRSSSADELQHKARSIYEKFIRPAASREVSAADSCLVSVQKRQK